MSHSKTTKPKTHFSLALVWILTLSVVVTGVILGLIYTFGHQVEQQATSSQPENSIKEQTINYDKNKILVDDTAEPLEIVELPSL